LDRTALLEKIGAGGNAQAQSRTGASLCHRNDKANAKKAYQDFFATWKDADADLPMLVAAKKEFAAL
jgi:hypothetical protein